MMLESLLLYWKAIAAAILAALLFAAGWNVGAGRVEAKWNVERLALEEQALAAEQANRAVEQAWNTKLQEAQNEAAKRETELKAAARAADAAARGLRDDIATIRAELPTASTDACRATADAALAVFGECADRYRAVASDADQLANERDALIDAWPSED
jgi:hypothetical protein